MDVLPVQLRRKLGPPDPAEQAGAASSIHALVLSTTNVATAVIADQLDGSKKRKKDGGKLQTDASKVETLYCGINVLKQTVALSEISLVYLKKQAEKDELRSVQLNRSNYTPGGYKHFG